MREIRRALYVLKQQYGFPVAIYYRGTDSVDLRTGVMSVSEVAHQVRRAVVLPSSLFAKMFRHFASAAFNYGTDLDVERRVFVIDRRDVPGVEIVNTDEWYLVYDHKRYSVEKLDSYDRDDCYFITGKELTGTQVVEQFTLAVQDRLGLADGFSSDASVTDALALTEQVTNA